MQTLPAVHTCDAGEVCFCTTEYRMGQVHLRVPVKGYLEGSLFTFLTNCLLDRVQVRSEHELNICKHPQSELQGWWEEGPYHTGIQDNFRTTKVYIQQ